VLIIRIQYLLEEVIEKKVFLDETVARKVCEIMTWECSLGLNYSKVRISIKKI
jgi:hypothetical protein